MKRSFWNAWDFNFTSFFWSLKSHLVNLLIHFSVLQVWLNFWFRLLELGVFGGSLTFWGGWFTVITFALHPENSWRLNFVGAGLVRLYRRYQWRLSFINRTEIIAGASYWKRQISTYHRLLSLWILTRLVTFELGWDCALLWLNLLIFTRLNFFCCYAFLIYNVRLAVVIVQLCKHFLTDGRLWLSFLFFNYFPLFCLSFVLTRLVFFFRHFWSLFWESLFAFDLIHIIEISRNLQVYRLSCVR